MDQIARRRVPLDSVVLTDYTVSRISLHVLVYDSLFIAQMTPLLAKAVARAIRTSQKHET